MGSIIVLCEHRQGVLSESTFEMLALARRLGDAHDLEVRAVLLEGGESGLAGALSGAADVITTVRSPELAEPNVDANLNAVAHLIEDQRPVLTLIGHTAAGMDLAPGLATRLGLPLATDCVEISLDEQGLEVVRHEYGGKIHARLVLRPAESYVVTVRPGSCEADLAGGGSGLVSPIEIPGLGSGRGRRFLGFVEASVADVDINEASILVAVGRGLGSPENLPAVQSFAEAVGATIACSRPVADKGWLAKSRQVGTSGQVVRPQLYVALGISGAYQHVAGMRGSGTIIAVNSDPAAPIFDVAHYGIVADMHEILPLLESRFSTR